MNDAVMITENCRSLIETLDDASLRQVAVVKLDGYTNEEIAAEQQCTVRTVERKLDRIRTRWERFDQEDRE